MRNNFIFNSKHSLTILLTLFFFVLPFGRLLWLPLLVMSITGIYIIFKQIMLTKGSPYTIYEKVLFFSFLGLWLPASLSLISSYDIPRTVEYIFTFPLFFGVGWFLFSSVDQGKLSKKLPFFLLAILLLWSFAVLWQLIDPNSPFGPPHGGRYHGFFNPAFGGDLKMAPTVMSMGLFAIALFWESGYKKTATFTAALVLIMVYVSGTRMVWLSSLYVLTFLMLILYVWRVKVSLKFIKNGFLFFGGILLVMYFVTANTSLNSRIEQSTPKSLDNFFSYNNINNILSNRLPIWEDAIEMGVDNPFLGTGANAWRWARPAYVESSVYERDVRLVDGRPRSRMTFAHQYVLDVFAGTGFTGILGLLIMYAGVVYITINAVLYRSFPAVLICLAFWAYFFPLNTHHSAYSSWLSAWFWVWLGLAIGFVSKIRKVNRI